MWRPELHRAALVALLLASAPASAEIYKCVAPDGAMSFSDQPCPQPPPPPRPAAPQTPAQNAPPPAAPVLAGVAEAPAPSDLPLQQAAPRAAAAVSQAPAAAGRGALFLVGVVLFGLSWIWMMVAAVLGGSIAWGIGLLTLSPVAMLAYPAAHWRPGRWPLLLALSALALCALFYRGPAALMHLEQSRLTSEEGDWQTRAAGVQRFAPQATVYVLSELRWDRAFLGDTHFVSWVWYARDQPLPPVTASLRFAANPALLRGAMPAATLGPGSHRVEVMVDGQLIDAHAFEVTPH